MKLRTIAEHDVDWRTIGKPVAVDSIRSITDDGKINSKEALKYAKNDKIASALLLLISKVPKVGKLVQQGTQHLGNEEEVQKYLLQYADSVEQIWPSVKDGISSIKAWKPYLKIFEKVVGMLVKLQQPQMDDELPEDTESEEATEE